MYSHCGERAEHHQRMRTWEACRKTIEHSEHDPERLAEERLDYAEARAGVVTQLESLERHPLVAFLLEHPSNSELWELPEVVEILLRNPHTAKRLAPPSPRHQALTCLGLSRVNSNPSPLR